MCLTSPVPITIDTSHKVYKILLVQNDGKRVTPFEKTFVDQDTLEGKTCFKAEYRDHIPYSNHIGCGYIHVYCDLSGAIEDFYHYFSCIKCGIDGIDKVEIYECEIPICNKAEYDPCSYCWVGLFDGDVNVKSAAAREIRFCRLIPESEIQQIYYDNIK